MNPDDFSNTKDRVLFVLKRANGYIPASQISVYAACDLLVVRKNLADLQKEGKVTSKFVTVRRGSNCFMSTVRREYKYIEKETGDE